MDKEIRQFNQARGLPQNYSNSLKFLDIMYPDPVYKRNTDAQKQKKFKSIFDNEKSTNQSVSFATTTSLSDKIPFANDLSDAKYQLPNLKKAETPFTKKSMIFHIVFGLIATIVLGFVLVAIFGDYSSFDVGQILKDMFRFSVNTVQATVSNTTILN